MPLVNFENQSEFCARHGGDERTLRTAAGEGTNVLICPDGARLDTETNIRWEPDTDPMRNLQWRIRYLQSKLANAKSFYSGVQADINVSLTCQAQGAGPGPGEEHFAALERVKNHVHEVEAELNDRRQELEAFRGPDSFLIQQERRADDRQAAAAARSRLHAIVGTPAPVTRNYAAETKQFAEALLQAAGAPKTRSK